MAIGMRESEDTEKIYVSELEKDAKEDGSSAIDKANKNNLIMIAVTAVVVIAIVMMVKSLASHGNNEVVDVKDSINASTEQTSGEVVDISNNVNDENTVEDSSADLAGTEMTVGLPDFDDADSNNTTTAKVYSASDYIKDLNGSDIPAIYEAVSRTYIKDFANYEAKRAIIDDGMELYWLEITYKGKAYRCQVPFYIFKSMDEAGICVVEIELLTLEGGEQIISFMQVIQDYDELIK